MNYLQEIIVQSIDLTNNTYTDSTGAIQTIVAQTAYLVPKTDGTHDRYVADDNGVVSKQAGGGSGGGGIITETDPTVPQYVKDITQANIDTWNNTTSVTSQIKITTATGFTTQTVETGTNLTQNGKNVLIDNGTNDITITTDINSPANFVATYIKLGTGKVTFVAGPGTTLQLADGTNVLGNIAYQRCAIFRNGTEFILYISYA